MVFLIFIFVGRTAQIANTYYLVSDEKLSRRFRT